MYTELVFVTDDYLDGDATDLLLDGVYALDDNAVCSGMRFDVTLDDTPVMWTVTVGSDTMGVDELMAYLTGITKGVQSSAHTWPSIEAWLDYQDTDA